VAAAQTPAQAAQGLQLARKQPAHLAHESRHVTREDLADQRRAARGERDHHEAPIVPAAGLGDQPAAHQVADHHRRVAVAAQQLGPQLALAERPVMQQGLQHAELPDGEAGARHHVADARGDRLGGAHKLDVGVERDGLVERARVARGHGFNSNGL
jgi:hypothetical protein